MKPVAISFVVPLFNHVDHTMAMLASLQGSLPPDLDYELIFVDDASTDGTREWLRTLADPRIAVVMNSRNLGFAGTCNAGARAAKGGLLGVLNNDLLFEPGWLAAMLDVLLAPELDAGLVGNVQYRVADGRLDHAGVCLTPAGQFDHVRELPHGAGRHWKSLAVTGACVLLRKGDFDALGGFDERYRNGCEDIDLCFRMRARGKEIYVAGDSRIRHHVSLSRDRSSPDNERNARRLLALRRPAIKRALSGVWAALLQAGPAAYAGHLGGQLDPSFVATPRTAARIIAESRLLREEHRWARELDGVDPNAEVACRCSASGLSYSPRLDAYTAEGNFEIAVANLRSTRNFYVCGRTVASSPQRAISIAIDADGLQEQTFSVESGGSVNVGIIDPILLPGSTSRFRVAAHFVDEQGVRKGDAGGALLITHIVVDDREVHALRSGMAR